MKEAELYNFAKSAAEMARPGAEMAGRGRGLVVNTSLMGYLC